MSRVEWTRQRNHAWCTGFGSPETAVTRRQNWLVGQTQDLLAANPGRREQSDLYNGDRALRRRPPGPAWSYGRQGGAESECGLIAVDVACERSAFAAQQAAR
jgi:hypothetical protein